tara:strand:- start:2357 stop:3241 length:885 start_codon:yes stop_codon:yes gene_type:complete
MGTSIGKDDLKWVSEQTWAYEAWNLLEPIEQHRWREIPLEEPTAPTKTGGSVDAGVATISDELLSAHVRARTGAMGGGHAVAPTDEFYPLNEEEAKEGKECPITLLPLLANDEGGKTFRVRHSGKGNDPYDYYDAEALYTWARKNPTNPMNNEPLSQNDLDQLHKEYGCKGGECHAKLVAITPAKDSPASKGKGKGKGKGTDATLPVARVIGVGKSSPATMYEVLILETQTVVEVPVCCCVPLLVGYEVECVDGRWYKISALYEDACALVLRGHPNEPPKRTPFEELVSVLFHF